MTTFAELTGGNLPKNKVFDGQSIAPQLRGEAGKPRAWVYNQLASMWYVRDAQWKLNHLGELYDMRDAPFAEKPVSLDSADPTVVSARNRLAAVLSNLNPAGGIPDTGDGTGRHASKAKKRLWVDRRLRVGYG